MKYTCVKTTETPSKTFFPGDFVEIKKLKHPAKLKNGTYDYKELTTGILMTKPFIKDNFKVGQFITNDYKLYGVIGFVSGLTILNIFI